MNNLNRTLYYITRTYLPSKTGGALMRAGAVEHLNRYFNVKVITVGSHTECINEVEVIGVPFNHNQRLMFWRERIGFIEDFLFTLGKIGI